MSQERIQSIDQLKKIIKSRTIASTPNKKYTCKVTSVTPYHREMANGVQQVGIANVNLMSSYHLAEAKRLAAEGDFDGAGQQNLSFSIRSTDYMPAKGEVIEVFVGTYVNKDGIEATGITAYNPIAAVSGAYVSDDMFDDLEPARQEVKTVDAEEPAFQE